MPPACLKNTEHEASACQSWATRAHNRTLFPTCPLSNCVAPIVSGSLERQKVDQLEDQ